MKNYSRLCLFVMLLTSSLSAGAVERVSLQQLNEQGWEPYVGHTIELTDTLLLCGNYYDSLILAPSRLIVPEERALGLAEGDSTMLRQLQEQNRLGHICLCCKPQNYRLRTGMRVWNVRGKVMAPRKMVTGRVPHFHHGLQDGVSGRGWLVRPRRPQGTTMVCAANIENMFYHLGGYAQQRTTLRQRDLQVKKISRGLHHLGADIYALCEVQQGDSAPQMLVDALNRRAGGKRYDYVHTDWPCADRIGGCFVYRTDRVRPVGKMLHAYADTTSHYYYRLLLQGFADNSGGRTFYLSLNHLRSKRGDAAESNYKRVTQTANLLMMLDEHTMQDSLTLLVGDYNCYTQEQPLQEIVRAGYQDMLPHDDDRVGGYSYVYHSEAGYLDRCFASPSMAEHVVRVQPFHVNADYYYSHGFKRLKDKSMRRYADHDPILIYIKSGL